MGILYLVDRFYLAGIWDVSDINVGKIVIGRRTMFSSLQD
jgi:hypothetical protein